MPWTIRIIDAPSFDVGTDGKNGYARLQVGDAWYRPELLEPGAEAYEKLAPNYLRDWMGKRAPIVIALPSRYAQGRGIGLHFCIDSCFWKDGEPYGDGWIVTGTAPILTLAPSVDIAGIYHGFIRDGVIGDDLEGGR